MKLIHSKTILSLTVLSLNSAFVWADETPSENNNAQPPVQTLETIKVVGTRNQNPVDNDISAVAKTIISRDEMLKFGDQIGRAHV